MLPAFLKKPIPKSSNLKKLRELVDPSLHTVCESARCPNIGECAAAGTLTFMILGDRCTRNCTFCAVEHGTPLPVDPDEPKKIAQSVRALGLKYVVITSVTRDDLPDGGTEQFIKVIKEPPRLAGAGSSMVPRVNLAVPIIEVLIPDNLDLDRLIAAKPDVINHNVETVPRLYPEVRPQADYQRSLGVLRYIKQKDPSICTKSGFMVGLGEKFEEVVSLLRDLKEAQCDLVTCGQYLSPSRDNHKVEKYLTIEEHQKIEEAGREMGLKVVAGPLVRSSYKAEEIWKKHKD